MRKLTLASKIWLELNLYSQSQVFFFFGGGGGGGGGGGIKIKRVRELTMVILLPQ